MIALYGLVLLGIVLLGLFQVDITEKLRKTRLREFIGALKIWWAPRAHSVKVAVVVAAGIVALGQAVSYTLFMFEESLQTTMFATWQVPKGGDKTALAKTYRTILDASWAFLYGLGWLNPLAFGAYYSYLMSAEQWYINAYGGP